MTNSILKMKLGAAVIMMITTGEENLEGKLLAALNLQTVKVVHIETDTGVAAVLIESAGDSASTYFSD